MPENENFIAYESGGSLYWRDMRTGDSKEIGVAMKTFKAIQDALESTLKERDGYFEMLVTAGLLERPRDPQDVAKEALEEARAARAESARMYDALVNQSAILEQLVTRISTTQTTDTTSPQHPDASSHQTAEIKSATTTSDKGGKR